MATDVLRPFRDTIDAASLAERTSFARAARNAVAQAIVASALASDATANVAAPEHEPPEAEIRALLGADLGGEVAALYRGGDDWPTRAIDLLTPLDEVARAR
ncbi:MAG: hypothetical protein ACJ77E_14145 [Gaiellaceae bacterium]